MIARVAALTGARSVRVIERVQALWSGYGEITRVALDDGTAIVKHVKPPSTSNTISDRRKRRSYEIERRFYRDYAPRCDDACRVAKVYASDDELLVLEDLDAAGFADRHDDGGPAVDACLAWLAAFHARFLGDTGEGLWPIGTYWQLDTRRDELAGVNGYLRTHADAIHARLCAAKFQTILHGDPKEANFCFGVERVAAVDFQYVGRGCAMRDVAYLLHGHANPRAHLDVYFGHLRAALPNSTEIEAEWRGLYDDARLDFERFLAGWRVTR